MDAYVNRDDPAFSYQLLDTHEREGYTAYVYNMTSQQWLDDGQFALEHHLYPFKLFYAGDIVKTVLLLRMQGFSNGYSFVVSIFKLFLNFWEGPIR